MRTEAVERYDGIRLATPREETLLFAFFVECFAFFGLVFGYMLISV